MGDRFAEGCRGGVGGGGEVPTSESILLRRPLGSAPFSKGAATHRLHRSGAFGKSFAVGARWPGEEESAVILAPIPRQSCVCDSIDYKLRKMDGPDYIAAPPRGPLRETETTLRYAKFAGARDIGCAARTNAGKSDTVISRNSGPGRIIALSRNRGGVANLRTA